LEDLTRVSKLNSFLPFNQKVIGDYISEQQGMPCSKKQASLEKALWFGSYLNKTGEATVPIKAP